MKVVDEKGKLFGKINLIDLIVIVVLILIVAAVVWKVAGNRIQSAVDNMGSVPTVRYEVVCANVDPDTCATAVAHIGDQLMSNGKMMNAHITNCVVEPYYTVAADAEGNAVQLESPIAKNLRFTIEAKVPLTNNAYAVGTQELRVGSGRPIGSMTRPSSSRPTPMSATRPVPCTGEPGRTDSEWLSRAAPTPSRLMSSAMP